MDARIYANGELLYSTAANDDKSALISPQVKAEIGKAGSLTFTILPTHPMYNDLQPFKTFMRVTIDGNEIFYGRVLDVSRDMYNQKNITCEGDLTFLMDSICTPGDYNKTPSEMLSQIISWHNAMVEGAKKFTLGTISENIGMRNNTVKFDVSNYTTNSDLLETELIGYYGGYIRTRANPNQNGRRIIDWIQERDYSSNQVIEYGSQMLDLTNNEAANDLFTVLLAVGDGNSKDGSSYDFPTQKIYVDDVIPGSNATATYGLITHVESFSGISDTDDLQRLGEEYIRNHYDPYPTELTVKAIDLHMLEPNEVETIKVGDTVKIQSTPHNLSKRLMCVSIDYDLESPENTSYVFGHPKQTLSQRYNKDKKESEAKSDKARKGGGKAQGTGDKNAKDLANETEIREQKDAAHEEELNDHNTRIGDAEETIDIFAKELNLQAGHINIDASRIDMNSVFTYINARRVNLRIGVLDASQVIVGDSGLSVPDGLLSVGGTNAKWKEYDVVTEVNVSRDTESNIAITFDGSSVAGGRQFSYVKSVSVKTETIHYLGKQHSTP